MANKDKKTKTSKNKIKKQQKGKAARIVALVLVSLLVVLGIGFIVIDAYIDSRLSLINYDTSGGSWENSDYSDEDYSHPLVLPKDESDEHIDENINVSDKEKEENINILLIGADTLNGKGRSDTMMLATVNPEKDRVVFTSFMRDSYVEIPGYGKRRLNAAHALGGPALLIETLETNFDIKIDNYIKVDFTSFKEAVDVIGGLTLTVNADNYDYFKRWKGIKGLSQAEAIDGTHTVFLDGEAALLYARNRNYRDGDFTRTLHQRDLVSQFMRHCSTLSFSEFDAILQKALPYVLTDIPQDELKELVYKSVTYLGFDIVSARVPCANTFEAQRINDAEVLVIDIEKNTLYLKTKIYG